MLAPVDVVTHEPGSTELELFDRSEPTGVEPVSRLPPEELFLELLNMRDALLEVMVVRHADLSALEIPDQITGDPLELRNFETEFLERSLLRFGCRAFGFLLSCHDPPWVRWEKSGIKRAICQPIMIYDGVV